MPDRTALPDTRRRRRAHLDGAHFEQRARGFASASRFIHDRRIARRRPHLAAWRRSGTLK